MMQIDRRFSSPNFEARRGFTKPELVILHYTGMVDGTAARLRLCDANAKVSAHYLIEEDGHIFQLVDETQRAWHAGQSFWRGMTDINSASLGIEIVNPGHEFGYRPFPETQMYAVLALCSDIKARHQLAAEAFIGHSDIAPLRKEDPGELFNWRFLAQHGIGLWPEDDGGDVKPRDESMTLAEALECLAHIGYARDAVTGSDDGCVAVIRAFQRHYVQDNLSGKLDAKTQKAIRSISRQLSIARGEVA